MSAWAVWVTMVSQGLSYFYFRIDFRTQFRQFQIDPRNGRTVNLMFYGVINYRL